MKKCTYLILIIMLLFGLTSCINISNGPELTLKYENGETKTAYIKDMSDLYSENTLKYESEYGKDDEVVSVEFDTVVESVETEHGYIDNWNSYSDLISCEGGILITVVSGIHNDVLAQLEKGTKIHVKTEATLEDFHRTDAWLGRALVSNEGTKDLTEITIIK